ncbi:MAG: VCBS repeat-containing protein [Bacteroidetes bacterium]|nr:VCBS repeat-containing protein [Bacteroidota bacterium]
MKAKLLILSITTYSYFNMCFHKADAQPVITSFYPISGPVGTSVTINGTNFNTTPSNNIVFFGAVKVDVSGGSTTYLNVIVPSGTTYGYISVCELTLGLTAYSSQPFIVTFPCGDTINTNSFAPKVDSATGGNPSSITISDLDGDGKPDIAVACSTAFSVSVLRNTCTTGTISFDPKVEFATGSNPQNVATGDLDGDGKPDLVVADYTDNKISVLRNTGTSGIISFATKVDFATGTIPYWVAIGDLDGDGKPDLAVANFYDNTISVLRNTGAIGTISFAPKEDFTAGSNPQSVTIGDLDEDGKPDLAIANFYGNTVSVLKNTGSSGTISFSGKVDFITGTNPYNLAMGDLDGDSKPDLTTANTGDSKVSVLRNTSATGTISFTAKVDFTTGQNPLCVSLGDLDGDGKPDIATANIASNTVSILKNNSTIGIISFATSVDFTTGQSPTSVSLGDLDGDGKPEISVTNDYPSSTSVLRNVIGLPDVPIIAVNGTTTFCQGDSVVLSSSAAYSYLWSNGATTQNVTVSTSGNFAVTVTNVKGCSSASTPTNVIVNPLPPTPTIILTNDTTLMSNFTTGNQWYLNDTLVIGAISQAYGVTQSGSYTVVITDTNGCSAISIPYIFTSMTIAELFVKNDMTIIYDPNSRILQITSKKSNMNNIEMFNLYGEKIYSADVNNKQVAMILYAQQPGIYFLKIQSDRKIYHGKIIIQ